MIPRPSASDLEGLSSARWGLLVPHLRAALAAVTPGSASPAAERLRDALPSALGSGRRRRELCRVVAEDELVWMELARRLDPLPDELAWVAGIGANDADEGDGGADGAGRPGAEGARLRERLREVQQERAELRRRLEGAEARAERAEQRARLAEADLARIEDERAELARAIEDADASRRRALERGERRAEGELERLRSELTALRRELGAVTTERDEARSRTSRVEADLAALRARPPVAPERAGRAVGLRPGRPSRLPPGVEDATTEAAELLLHPGRLVLIDGYNLTLRHRGHLDLAQQRAWLATTMAAFVARVRIRPVLVFDGERAGGNRTMPPARGVDVVFTSESVIADDEIVLAVEATDEPVVVVTDDQELRARVRALGADVVPTSNLLGVVGG